MQRSSRPWRIGGSGAIGFAKPARARSNFAAFRPTAVCRQCERESTPTLTRDALGEKTAIGWPLHPQSAEGTISGSDYLNRASMEPAAGHWPAAGSDRNLELDRRMRVIAIDVEILDPIIVDRGHISRQAQPWRTPWLSRDLRQERFDVV